MCFQVYDKTIQPVHLYYMLGFSISEMNKYSPRHFSLFVRGKRETGWGIVQ